MIIDRASTHVCGLSILICLRQVAAQYLQFSMSLQFVQGMMVSRFRDHRIKKMTASLVEGRHIRSGFSAEF